MIWYRNRYQSGDGGIRHSTREAADLSASLIDQFHPEYGPRTHVIIEDFDTNTAVWEYVGPRPDVSAT